MSKPNTSQNVKRTSVSVPNEAYAILQEAADANDMSVSELFREGAAILIARKSMGEYHIPKDLIHPPTRGGARKQKQSNE